MRSQQSTLVKRTEIDLTQPFEHVLATVLSLPSGSDDRSNTAVTTELTHSLRGLYEAANGRHVGTAVGLVPIAPPVAPFLKEKPFNAATQREFLTNVARVVRGSNHSVSNNYE
jgi:hypothetical protein